MFPSRIGLPRKKHCQSGISAFLFVVDDISRTTGAADLIDDCSTVGALVLQPELVNKNI